MSLSVVVADCEAVHSGWPNQPVNAWSSLVFVVAGAVLVFASRSRGAHLIGFGAAGVGIASLMFHGDLNGFAWWLHDWTIAVLLLVLLAVGFRDEPPIRRSVLVPIIGVGGLIAVVPASGEVIHGVLGVTAGVRVFMARKDMVARPLLIGAALLGAGAALTILGRSGGPWCVPEALFQPHAGWHFLAPAALIAYAVSSGWPGGSPDISERHP